MTTTEEFRCAPAVPAVEEWLASSSTSRQPASTRILHEIERRRVYEVERPRSIEELRRDRFSRLAQRWLRVIALESSAHRIVSNPSYLQLVAMGAAVIPLILERVASGERHWSWALRTLTGHNLSSDLAGDLARQADAWLEWGRGQNLVR